jgi:hypothetical protein
MFTIDPEGGACIISQGFAQNRIRLRGAAVYI